MAHKCQLLLRMKQTTEKSSLHFSIFPKETRNTVLVRLQNRGALLEQSRTASPTETRHETHRRAREYVEKTTHIPSILRLFPFHILTSLKSRYIIHSLACPLQLSSSFLS